MYRGYDYMERIQVANVQEAVELAFKFKDERRYDWFRGQTLERPPYSSLFRMQFRRDEEAVRRNRQRVSMFCQWAAKIEPLAELLEEQNVHQLFAILQHYSVATHYIDFSTDTGVAGFFACDAKEPPVDGLSCIYCLDTKDLKETWEIVGQVDERKNAEIEQVVVDVKNLWRLQAQSGVFLYSNYNWDVDYPMDRIVFPYTGYPAAPTKERIYPNERSALEHLLDQYFAVERSTFTGEELRQMVTELQAKGRAASIGVMKTWERGIYAPAFVDASLLTEPVSWE